MKYLRLQPDSTQSEVKSVLKQFDQVVSLLALMKCTLEEKINGSKIAKKIITKIKKGGKNDDASAAALLKDLNDVPTRTKSNTIHQNQQKIDPFCFDQGWFILLENLETWFVNAVIEVEAANKKKVPQWKLDLGDAINENINRFEEMTREVQKLTSSAVRQEQTVMGEVRAFLGKQGSLTAKKLKIKLQERSGSLDQLMRNFRTKNNNNKTKEGTTTKVKAQQQSKKKVAKKDTKTRKVTVGKKKK